MRKKYRVKLKDDEREQLRQMIHCGKDSARRLAHARVLLKCDEGLMDLEVSDEVDVSVGTVERVRKRYSDEGLEAALSPRPQPKRPHKRRIDGDNEARLMPSPAPRPPTATTTGRCNSWPTAWSR